MDLFRESLRFDGENMEGKLERDMEKDATTENFEKKTIQTMVEFEEELERQYNSYKLVIRVKELGEDVADALEIIYNRVRKLVNDAKKEKLLSKDEEVGVYEKFGMNNLEKKETNEETEEQEK